MRTLPNLAELGLRNTRISDKGLVHLETMKNLRFLRLEDTEATAKGTINLEQAVPRIYLIQNDN